MVLSAESPTSRLFLDATQTSTSNLSASRRRYCRGSRGETYLCCQMPHKWEHLPDLSKTIRNNRLVTSYSCGQIEVARVLITKYLIKLVLWLLCLVLALFIKHCRWKIFMMVANNMWVILWKPVHAVFGTSLSYLQ